MINTPHEITDKLYNHVYWAWHGEQKLFLEWAAKHFELTQQDVNKIYRPNLVGQMVPFLDNKNTLIWIDNQLPMSDGLTYVTIAHECQHATFHVLRTRGVDYSKKSEEAFTYHSSWLMTELIKAFVTEPPRRKSGRRKS